MCPDCFGDVLELGEERGGSRHDISRQVQLQLRQPAQVEFPAFPPGNREAPCRDGCRLEIILVEAPGRRAVASGHRRLVQRVVDEGTPEGLRHGSRRAAGGRLVVVGAV